MRFTFLILRVLGKVYDVQCGRAGTWALTDDGIGGLSGNEILYPRLTLFKIYVIGTKVRMVHTTSKA
jgi:hypothetical protein